MWCNYTVTHLLETLPLRRANVVFMIAALFDDLMMVILIYHFIVLLCEALWEYPH